MKKIYTFDLWDTVLKRKCHPEEIKLKTAQLIFIEYYDDILNQYRDIYKILRERNNIESSIVMEHGECLIDDVINELLLKITDLKVSKEEVKKIVYKEIDIEKQSSYVNEEVKEYLKKFKNYDKYCISDFYMNSEEIKEILKYHKLLKYFKKIYVSADYNLTKRNNGELFSYFSKQEGIDYKSITHFGDNDISDIENARKLGIETVKIFNKNEFRFDISSPLMPDIDFSKIYTNDKYFNIGIQFSPLAYFFIYDLVCYFKIKDAKTILYQTREGETFIQFHELLEQNNPFIFDIPKAKLLEVSRISTFGASIENISISSLLRMWSQYRKQSTDSLFKTLHLDINKYKSYIEKYDIDTKDIICNPWFDFKINHLISDKDFCKEVNKDLEIKRREFIKYLDKHIIGNTQNNRLYLVDIGWRGSIQDNISYILPTQKIYGYYMALFERYNVERENVEKAALFDNLEQNYDIVAPIITLLELLFNSQSGSVVNYKDGEAVRKIVKEESEFSTKYIIPIQKGMQEGFKYINNIMKYHPVSRKIYINYIHEYLKNIKINPSYDIIKLYYKNIHNDIFGSGEIVKKYKLTWRDKFEIKKLKQKYQEEEWKEAFIKINNLRFLNFLIKFKNKIRRNK